MKIGGKILVDLHLDLQAARPAHFDWVSSHSLHHKDRLSILPSSRAPSTSPPPPFRGFNLFTGGEDTEQYHFLCLLLYWTYRALVCEDRSVQERRFRFKNKKYLFSSVMSRCGESREWSQYSFFKLYGCYFWKLRETIFTKYTLKWHVDPHKVWWKSFERLAGSLNVITIRFQIIFLKLQILELYCTWELVKTWARRSI